MSVAPTPRTLLTIMDIMWWYAWEITRCADCAERAANGGPWGQGACWDGHRSHLPILALPSGVGQ